MILLERRSGGGERIFIPIHLQYLQLFSTVLCAPSRGGTVMLLNGCTGLPACSRILVKVPEAPDVEGPHYLDSHRLRCPCRRHECLCGCGPHGGGHQHPGDNDWLGPET